MRVTNSMLINNFLRNLNSNLSRLERTQNRFSTGKQISCPSDDPIGLVLGMGLRSNLAGLKQYRKNADSAAAWLENTDSALESATDILHRAKELAVYGAGGTMDAESIKALSKEVAELLEEMRQVANTNFAGRYIFAGNNTQTQPFPPPEEGEYKYVGTIIEQKLEIGVNIVIPYSVTGDRVFGKFAGFGASGMLEILAQLRDLLAGEGEGTYDDSLTHLDEALEHILSIRAEVGARTNRLELVKERLSDSQLNYTRLLSEIEDADLAETIINLKNQENVYLASLSAGARIIQPSLLDFLR
ncbi:MAG: flagellar hook-associated protein FlgL [Firmicutes bacterium]|nr:flagellar hook-associated protein FlgL [Bacillota bacterium]